MHVVVWAAAGQYYAVDVGPIVEIIPLVEASRPRTGDRRTHSWATTETPGAMQSRWRMPTATLGIRGQGDGCAAERSVPVGCAAERSVSRRSRLGGGGI